MPYKIDSSRVSVNADTRLKLYNDMVIVAGNTLTTVFLINQLQALKIM